MKVLNIVPIHVVPPVGKVIATVYEATVEKNEHVFPYFFVGRGDNLSVHPNKSPDAVVVVAIVEINAEPHIVLVDEFRPPIGAREISFPAGLIDPEDYAASINATWPITSAIKRAAIREFKEETGMDLQVTEMSPLNIYSSAGLSNESSTYVFGYASGTPSSKFLDHGEDIHVIVANKSQLRELMDQRGVVFSRAVWPFLWFFDKIGISFVNG